MRIIERCSSILLGQDVRLNTVVSRRRFTPLFIILIFATAWQPFIGSDQRNYLVIASCVVSFFFMNVSTKIVRADILFAGLAILYSFFTVAILDSVSDLTTVAYTALLSFSYLAITSELALQKIQRKDVAKLLERIIILFAVVSVIQLLASAVGLPVPNLILAKESWSYNSLAVEPSHAGRTLAITMLAYLLITRKGYSNNIYRVLKFKWKLATAFVVGILLTGSAVAIVAAPLSIFLALSRRWIAMISGLLVLIWPLLYLIELPAVRRILAFITALPSMDISTLVEADQSGALRFIPTLMYIEKSSPSDSDFWFGAGLHGITNYVLGELIGAGDLVAAGFVPGYMISFGIFGTILFLHAFVYRFISRSTAPLILLWVLLFTVSAWNTQVFWYGLMLVKVVYHLELSIESSTAFRRKRFD